jgi:hypothetical protein
MPYQIKYTKSSIIIIPYHNEFIIIIPFGGADSMCLSPESAFHLWVCGFIDSRCTWKELVNALPKVVGFLWVLRFPPTGKVDRVG